MSRAVCFAVALFLTTGTPAHAQGPGGSKCTMWRMQTLGTSSDSVLVTSALFMGPEGKSWVLKLPDRSPITVRVVASGGDSMVTEAGPYPSVLRPGRTVTLLRMVAHVYNKDMSGTMEAHYDSGSVFQGRIRGSCGDKK